MSSKRKRLQNRTGSILGALVIESLAAIVMLGLLLTIQDERSKAYSVEELVKPKMVFADEQNVRSDRYLIPVYSEFARGHSSRKVQQ